MRRAEHDLAQQVTTLVCERDAARRELAEAREKMADMVTREDLESWRCEAVRLGNELAEVKAQLETALAGAQGLASELAAARAEVERLRLTASAKAAADFERDVPFHAAGKPRT